MVRKEYIIVIDLVLVVGSLLVIAAMVGYSQPLVIAPIDDYVSADSAVLFSFEHGERILIDDSLDFNSPEVFEVTDDIIIRLNPGVHYWKVEGILSSDVRTLTIESVVDLRLQKSNEGEGYDIVNAGNERLYVDVYENGTLTGNVILDSEEETTVSGTTIIGGKHE